MYRDKCDSFVNGLRCAGLPNSELCRNCPSMRAGHWRTPDFCKAYRQTIERKAASKQPKDDVRSALDSQVGGTHYSKLAIQPMEYSIKNNLDALQHTMIKYATRHKDKNGVEDLKKIIHTAKLAALMQYGVEL